MQETKRSVAVSQHHKIPNAILTNRLEALATSRDLNSECKNVTSATAETAMEIAGQNKPQKPDELSAETKQLREKRRQMKRGGTDVQNIEYVDTCKAIRRRMAEGIRSYNEERQLQALKNNKGLKSVKRKQLLGRNNIVSLKEEDGTLIRDFNRMIQRCEEFYTKLYSTRQARQSSVLALPAAPPPILPSEVRVAIKRLKRGKAPGEDNITTAVLQDGEEPIIKALTQLFNRCLSDRRVPSSWKNASVVLIHKKGDTADIRNYRPISLLPVIYKVFSHILLQRMLQTLEQHQPQEQAGFRPGFSTTDHIHVVSQLQEKANEYKIPLCFAFVDYEKAFDSIEFTPLFTALANQGVDPAYITILKDLYNGATSTLKLHKDSNKINLERGARQGDNISPKLFTACLHDAIINKIDWEEKGINIDGEHLSHLIFANDIILIAHTPLHCARRGLDKNIVSTTAPERAVLSVMSLGVALRTDESGASEAAETVIFLASIWLAFASHVVLFWLNATCFEVGLIRTVIDNVTGSQRAA